MFSLSAPEQSRLRRSEKNLWGKRRRLRKGLGFFDLLLIQGNGFHCCSWSLVSSIVWNQNHVDFMVTISFDKLRSSALASLSNLSKWMLSKISTWFWRREVLLRTRLSLGFGAIWNVKVFYSSINLYNETNITWQHLACHQFKSICVKLYTNMSFEHQPQRGTISILSTATKEIKKRVLKKNAAGKNQQCLFPWHCRAFNKGYHVTEFQCTSNSACYSFSCHGTTSLPAS